MKKDFFKEAVEVLKGIILAIAGSIQIFSRKKSLSSLQVRLLKLDDVTTRKSLAGVPP